MAEELQRGMIPDTAAEGAQTTMGVDLGSLLGGLLAGNTASQNASQSIQASEVISQSALSDGIGAVLRDPQMMAKLPDMIAMLKPLMGNSSGSDAAIAAEEKPREPEQVPPGASLPASPSGKGKGCRERRIALLCALRPYLSPRRREAIDYILRMDKMGKLFRNG